MNKFTTKDKTQIIAIVIGGIIAFLTVLVLMWSAIIWGVTTVLGIQL